MSDGKPKVQIPAWQRAPTTPPASEDPVVSQPEPESKETAEKTVETSDAAQSSEEPESVPSADTSPTTAPQAEDPAGHEQYLLHASDFDEFKQQQQSQQPTPRQAAPSPPQQQAAAPPIITYPEFLVEAHKPPPLITPGRILNVLYAAGGASAILYGASKWIIRPMLDELSIARHEFMGHSQAKVDEFNERLAKIVSKTPEPKPATSDADDEVESITSDPTELYHRDMGTQTSPPPTPQPTTGGVDENKDLVTHAEDVLQMLRSRMEELADGSEKAGESHKDRLENINKLRHYLDGLIYGTPSISQWQTAEDAITTKNGDSQPAKEDQIEELKKEIRSVKGVLLSAKRFPVASRPVAGTA